MKGMELLKRTVLHLLTLCLVCAVTAFFLPGISGSVLCTVTAVLAAVIGVLCVSGLVYMMMNRGYSAD